LSDCLSGLGGMSNPSRARSPSSSALGGVSPLAEKSPKRMTLGETVYHLVVEKKTASPEFQSLLQYYGREKLRSLYFAEKLRHEEIERRKKGGPR